MGGRDHLPGQHVGVLALLVLTELLIAVDPLRVCDKPLSAFLTVVSRTPAWTVELCGISAGLA
jgi:hypothetical protein